MSPVLLSLEWHHPGDFELEMYLHGVFEEFRSHGEWFVFGENPIPLIKAAVKEWYGKLEEPPYYDTASDIWDL